MKVPVTRSARTLKELEREGGREAEEIGALRAAELLSLFTLHPYKRQTERERERER